MVKYYCESSQCKSPEFTNLKEWSEHQNRVHGKTWQCTIEGCKNAFIYSNYCSYRSHCNKQHPGQKPEYEPSTMPSRPANSSLCNNDELDAKRQLLLLKLGYYPPFQAIYCPSPTCKSFIMANDIARHMKTTHKKAINGINSMVESIVRSLPLVTSISELIYKLPVKGGPKLAFLEEPSAGIMCLECSECFKGRTTFYTHRKITGHTKKPSKVLVQRLMPLHLTPASKYPVYRVIEGNLITNVVGDDSLEATGTDVKEIRSVVGQLQASEGLSRKATSNMDDFERGSAWLRRTGWPAFFKSKSLSLAVAHDIILKDEEVADNYAGFKTTVSDIFNADLKLFAKLSPETRTMIRGDDCQNASKPVNPPQDPLTFPGYVETVFAAIVLIVDLVFQEVHEQYGMYLDRKILAAVREVIKWIQELEARPANIELNQYLFESTRKFLYLLFTYRIVGDTFKHPLVAAMAFLSIKTSKQFADQTPTFTFANPVEFRRKCAAYMYLTRMFIITTTVREVMEKAGFTDFDEFENAMLDSEDDHDREKLEIALGEACSKFLRKTSPTVFRIIVGYFNYAAAASDASGETIITWDAAGQYVRLFRDRLSIAQFKQTIINSMLELQNLLEEQLLFAKIEELLPDSTMQSMSKGFGEHSFVDSVEANELLGEIVSRAKLNGILHSRLGLGDGFNQDSQEAHLERLAIFAEYQRAALKAVKRLAAVIQITCGQPARGTEVMEIAFRAHNGECPNIFLDHGQVVIVTTYHKSLALTRRDKLIFRFLPNLTGKLLVAYVLWVRPIINLQRSLQNLENEMINIKLFSSPTVPGYTLRSKDLTHEMQNLFQRGTGIRIGIHSHRHLSQAIARKYFTEVFKGLCTERVIDEEDDLEGTLVFDEQMAHTKAIADLVYAVDGEHLGSMSTTYEKFRVASTILHNWLLNAEATPVKNNNKRKRTSDALQEDPIQPSLPNSEGLSLSSVSGSGIEIVPKITEQPGVLKALHSITGHISYRNEGQQKALELILQGISPCIVILPTGAGKSLLFMLPTRLSMDGISIIVCPLQALLQDLQARLAEKEVPHFVWTGKPISRITHGTVILIISEMVANIAFEKFTSELSRNHLLKRIVFDEAHMAVTESSYRDALLRAGHIFRFPAQLIFLSATIPDFILPDLKRTFFLPENPTILRRSTVRPNIRYQILQAKGSSVRDTVVRCVRAELEYLGEDEQILIVNVKIADAEKVQELLGKDVCGLYTGKSAPEDREKTLRAYRSGHLKVVSCTKGFGTGIDMPFVHHVYHNGAPSSIIDYFQETGRAGRTGKESKAVVVSATLGAAYIPSLNEVGPKPQWWTLMHRYMKTRTCLRAELSRIFDGSVITCQSDPSYLNCSNCEILREDAIEYPLQYACHTTSKTFEAYNEMTTKYYSTASDRQKTFECFSDLRQKAIGYRNCSFCAYTGRNNLHRTKDCPNVDERAKVFVETMSTTLITEGEAYKQKRICFNCHFGSPVCSEWEDCSKNETQAIAVAALYAAHCANHIRLPLDPEMGNKTHYVKLACSLGREKTKDAWTSSALLHMLKEGLCNNPLYRQYFE